MGHKRAFGRGRVAWVSMLAASCLTLTLAIHGAVQDALPGPATPQDAITAILDAFRSFRVVSFPGGHTDANESQALLRALVADPRFGATVNDIVVEFGSSRYQDVMDRYIRGEDVPESTVQRTRVFTVRAEGSLTKWQADTASWKPMSVTAVRGTALGAADFSEFENPEQRYHIRGEEDFVRRDSPYSHATARDSEVSFSSPSLDDDAARR